MSLELYVFDVDHGAAALVQSPQGYGLLIDCGVHSAGFSPAKWIHDNLTLTAFGGHRLTELIVTHPHTDHIDDIENVKQYLDPALLLRQSYTWDEVPEDTPAKEFNSYVNWQKKFSEPAAHHPNWGMDLQVFGLTPNQAKGISSQSFVNNSSLVTVVSATFGEVVWKLLFGGDLEAAGWEELLKNTSFATSVARTDVFIVPHHGHESGYSPMLFEKMGSPYINIASIKAGDEHVDSRYSTNAKGLKIRLNGEKRERKLLTTRSDHTIHLVVGDDGTYRIELLELT